MLFSTIIFIALFSLNFALNMKNCGSDCISIRNCPAADSYLTPMTVERMERAMKSYCGFSYIDGMQICCSDFKTSIVQKSRFGYTREEPTATTTSTTTTTTTTTTTPPPTTTPEPDVTDHPNMKLLPDTCGFIDEDRIISGEVAHIYEFPWMALISYYDQGLAFECSGTLINSQYILTAAHCVKGVNVNKIAGVRIGEFDIRTFIDCQDSVCESTIQDRRVAEKIVHKEYSGYPNYENDIALLRLSPSIDMTPRNAGTICLPVTQELRNAPITNKVATVAGWGLTEFGRESTILRKVHIPVRSKDECELYYRPVSNANSTRFCAGQKKKDSCRGDSGGPLMIGDYYKGIYKYVQFGIVSSGSWKCGTDTPGIYTDVRQYVDWILDNIRE